MQRTTGNQTWARIATLGVLVSGAVVLMPGRAVAQSATIGVAVTVVSGEHATKGQAVAQAELARAALVVREGKSVKAANGINTAGVASISRDTFVVVNGRPVPRNAVEAVGGKEVLRVTLEYAAN